jgi:hypothetical protein
MKRKRKNNYGFDLEGTTKTVVGGVVAIKLIETLK